MRKKIKKLFQDNPIDKTETIRGWVKTLRKQKNFAFIEINDGSCFASMQAVIDDKSPDWNKIDSVSTGAAVGVTGKIVQSPGKNQTIEMHAQTLEVFGACDAETYPLQKKRHSFEFLREIAHLRPRTNTQGAVIRMRNLLAYATHEFFQQKGFCYIHTPIITPSDCEGSGELFKVSTLDFDKLPRTKKGDIDYKKDFFETPTFLTVSGQLNVEAFACSLSDVYTFGPTFRAENSHTSRHLSEFWMIEPEIAFADLNDNISLAKEYIQFIVQKALENGEEDLLFFDKFIEKGLMERLNHIIDSPFEEISYTEAVEILKKVNSQFEYPVEWGHDLQSEHERYLTEKHFKKPVVVRDYPSSLKAFYMRENEDGKTVAAMDLLVPKIGEIIGGSQREERLDRLEKRLEMNNLPKEHYQWYLDLRKYGSVPHAGFGVGFERLVQFITGIENIRDVIPFPRSPGNAKF